MWINEGERKPKPFQMVHLILQYFVPTSNSKARTSGFGYWTDDKGWLTTDGKSMKDMGVTIKFWLEPPEIEMPGWEKEDENALVPVYMERKND